LTRLSQGHISTFSSDQDQLYIYFFQYNTIVDESRSTRSSRSTCCPRHSVMLSLETFEKIERLLTFSSAKPRENAEVMLKKCELCNYGDMLTVISLFFKNVLKIYNKSKNLKCKETFVYIYFTLSSCR
jgi:hypothetical protein